MFTEYEDIEERDIIQFVDINIIVLTIVRTEENTIKRFFISFQWY